MGKFRDLTGQRFGRLKVVEKCYNSSSVIVWKCLCDCGNTSYPRAYELLKGIVVSCGCYRRETSNRTLINLHGKRFGRLLVKKRIGVKHGAALWRCQCDCGNSKMSSSADLRSGHTTSCGCLNKERLTTHNMSYTRQYKTWRGILERCQNINHAQYNEYGGRGIIVCEKWQTFEGFWEDMQEGYQDNLTIDRKDNNKGYYKENCRWATKKQQANNRRNSIYLTYQGETKTVSEWAETLGLTQNTIRLRLKRYSDINKILDKRVRKCHRN